MAKIKRVTRCYHCGAVLQDKNPKEKGYITPEVLNREIPVQIIYCNNCYENMKAFNNSVLDQAVDNQIIKILEDAVATDALILWVVDLFSFNGTINPQIAKKLKKLKVVVIGTKIDLFPSDVKEESLKEFIRLQFNEVGIEPTEIVLLGNPSTTNAKDFISRVNELRRGHDVYMIGNSSSGKTTLINSCLKIYENKSKSLIKTATYPNTDVKVLEIPLTKSASFYELPGLASNSILTKVEKEIHKFLIPKKNIKITYRTLSSGESLMIGSVGAFSVINGKASIYKFYAAEGVETHKLMSKHLEGTISSNNRTKLYRPVSNRLSTFLDYDMFEYEMENDGLYHDISVEGLGWVSFQAKGQIIRVMLPKGVAVKEGLGKIRNVNTK